MITSAQFRENLARVRDQIASAAVKAGRTPDDITLIGVTKKHPGELLEMAVANGLDDLGENRVQESRQKLPGLNLGKAVRHFIGHVQTNKVKYLPGLIDVLHSVDSTRLAGTLNARFEQADTRLPVFLQVNISGEDSKTGLDPAQLSDLTGYCLECSNLDVVGFMTIGPLTEAEPDIHRAFDAMRGLVSDQQAEYGERLGDPGISMGMSGDFEIAIMYGATHVRVGTALFGPRT